MDVGDVSHILIYILGMYSSSILVLWHNQAGQERKRESYEVWWYPTSARLHADVMQRLPKSSKGAKGRLHLNPFQKMHWRKPGFQHTTLWVVPIVWLLMGKNPDTFPAARGPPAGTAGPNRNIRKVKKNITPAPMTCAKRHAKRRRRRSQAIWVQDP